MTVSKLATRSSGNAGQYSTRGGRKIDRFIVHHAATSNLDVVLSMMRTGSREVSSNYVISNSGEIISVVPEEYRAWTSASPAWDGRAITVEVVNSKVGDPWPISAKAQAALERLIADVASRYGFTPKRAGKNSTVIGHRELYTWFGASYATACPGGMNLDTITHNAAKQTSSKKGGNKVVHYHFKDKDARAKGRVLKPYEHLYLNTKSGGLSNFSNVVGQPGDYSLTAHVYAKGEPGENLDLKYVWQDPKGKNSDHYVQRLTFDKQGVLSDNIEFKRRVPKGYRVMLRVQAPSSNKKPFTVTLLDSDAYLFV